MLSVHEHRSTDQAGRYTGTGAYAIPAAQFAGARQSVSNGRDTVVVAGLCEWYVHFYINCVSVSFSLSVFSGLVQLTRQLITN